MGHSLFHTPLESPGMRCIPHWVLMVMGVTQMGQGIWIFLKAELAQQLFQRAWAKTLRGESRVPPWPWADTWPVARLLLPKYEVDLIVLAGANGRTLAFGPGHLLASAEPGHPGTTVLTGHRDTHFRFLEKVQIGDELFMKDIGLGPIRYVIREIRIVDARTAEFRMDGLASSLALVTCYPFDAISPGGPLRYVVVADETERTKD